MSGGEKDDGDLNDKLIEIVRKYLAERGFKQTEDAFLTECGGHRVEDAQRVIQKQQHDAKNVLKENLLRCFDEGKKEEFFQHFQPFSTENQQQKTYLQLEFHLEIYFAVHLMSSAKGTEDEVKDKIEAGRKTFKSYLETRGSALSQESDFLPYFALPFIENPTQHLSFTELFQESWVKNVRNELETFLNEMLGDVLPLDEPTNTSTVDLSSIYRRYRAYGEMEESLRESQEQLQLKNDDLAKLQVNYRNLMGMAVELLSALEVMVKGEDVNLTKVIDVCLEAFPELFPLEAKSNQNEDRLSVQSENAASSISDKTVSDKNHNFTKARPKPYDGNLSSLNYKRLKQDLVSGPLRLKIFLLQALRWRLTRTPPGIQRRMVLLDYIANDLLGVQGGIYNSSISQLVMSPNVDLHQTMLRLINSFASLSIGRSYLAQKSGIVSAVIDCVLFNKFEPLSLDMALAALQKLSLRRELQTAMIHRDLIDKLVLFLESVDGYILSDYSLEYSVALLMNLSLRSAGKIRCARQPQKILKVLTNLLGSKNQDIIPYVNGTLYSLLTNPGIRKEALSMGLEDMLKCFMQENNADIKRQLEFILKQLTAENPIENTISDFEDEDDDDDEENDVLEEELDMNDDLAIAQGELQGELLFSTHYLLTSGKTNSKQSELSSLQSDTPRSLEGKTESHIWTKLALTETASIDESLSCSTVTLDSSPKSIVLDHYATQVVTKAMGFERSLSEAVDFPPVLPKDSDTFGKSSSVNEYIVAFSSRPKIRRTPEQSPIHLSRRSIKYETDTSSS